MLPRETNAEVHCHTNTSKANMQPATLTFRLSTGPIFKIRLFSTNWCLGDIRTKTNVRSLYGRQNLQTGQPAKPIIATNTAVCSYAAVFPRLDAALTYHGFPEVCLSSSRSFSSSVNCRSSSKELLSRSWMYCSMLLLERCGGVDSCGDSECDELDWATCMLLNWLRRSSYYADKNDIAVVLLLLLFFLNLRLDHRARRRTTIVRFRSSPRRPQTWRAGKG